MTKKFTQEQYQKIIEIAYEYKINSAFGIIGDTTQKSIGAEFFETDLNVEIDFYDNAEEIMALVNPLTREWAHDKFVYEEPKFHFILKDIRDSKDKQYHLVKNGTGAIILYPFRGADKPAFKESEIIKWGFNPKAFDREEV